MAFKESFIEMLEGLTAVDPAISVEGGGDTYRLSYNREHALRFRLHYLRDHGHFLGYVIDNDDGESQAIVSIRTLTEAAEFVTAARSLFGIRARRREGEE
jgi:hypothetical protein